MTAPATTGREKDTPNVDYRVLGPLAATTGQTRVELGGKRQRLVLAVLLSNANRVIAQDALVDAVWNDDLPDSGARSLHTYVSQLRKALHGGIERDGEGYVLAVEPEQVDALRFEALVEEARSTIEDNAAGAAAMLRRGLGLWAGTAYGDLGFEPALVGEAIRLAEERVTALELRFEVDLLLGRHEQIVSEIEALLREQPYREHLAAMLMLALFRSGRQAEALRVYRHVRHRLVEELGIEPGQELQDLELRILEGDPTLQAPSAGRRGSGPDQVHGSRGYEIHERIGTTEFGDRYRGFHGTMGREVGVLVIDRSSANSPQFIRQFEAEMQTVSRFEHPHLAPVYDYWRDPSTAYVITPFYGGGSLGTAIADQPLTLGGAIRLADQLSAALGFLHRQGHPHGAVSAGSVFLDEELNAYLGDTGLPRILGHDRQDEADDIYQLGALVYQSLTLRRPDGVVGVSELRADLPSELDHALSRALHPDPSLRYQRVEGLARALRQSAGLDFMAVPRETAPEGGRRNPYKGLRAFQEADASDFHGRDALVEELVEALTSSRLMAVVGPSGSGKSSVVRAGLIPRLRQGAIPSSEGWLITDMFPGANPFESLEGALLRVATARPVDLDETLTADEYGLGRIVDQLAEPGSEILIVIDQFEELFSMVSSTAERRLFLDSLVAATDIDSSLRIVLTLRADFFDQPLQYPEFADVFRSNLVAVSPPTRDGLARAVSQPASTAGMSLEPGLVTRIVDDVIEQPGGLPLLQFALTELFARREGDTLTLDAYDRSGGVGGALANRAEETYSSLSPAGQEAARQLFLRLVTVDDLADDTRRRVRQSELLGLDIDRTVMSDIMQQFGALRFLSFDRDPASRAPTVELAHESLLREWQRLRTWIDERREDLLIHRRIQLTVQDWEGSDRDHSYLLRGSRLEQALAWVDRTEIAVSEEEIAFIEASVENERQERAEREALEDKARRRRRALMGALAGGLVIAGVLGAVALERAEEARITAAEATARGLASEAIAAIDEDPELGVLLSLEAIAATEAIGVDTVPEAASALRTTLADTRIEARLPTGYGAVAYSGDGTRLVTDDYGDYTTLLLREAEARAELARWTVPQGADSIPVGLRNVAFGPDDAFLATTWVDVGDGLSAGETMGAVTLHDPNTLDLELSLSGELGAYWAPSFGADGLIAATFSGENDVTGVYVWDRETGQMIDRFVSDPPILGGAFIPDTTILVLAHSGIRAAGGDMVEPGRLQAVDVTTSEEVWVIPDLEINPSLISVSPDGSKAAFAFPDNNLFEIWDLGSLEQVHSLQLDPLTLAWSLDSSRLAFAGNDTDVTILDEDHSWSPLTLTGHKTAVWGAAFHPGGKRLASAEEGQVLIWDITETGAVGDEAVALGSPILQFFLGPEGRLVAATDDAGGVTIDLATGDTIAALPIEASHQLMPNDRFTTVVGEIGRGSDLPPVGVVVDALTGEVLRSFPACLNPHAISFDDRLVALESLEGCDPNDTPAPNQVLDLVNEEIVIDLGEQQMNRAVLSPEGFDGPPYAAVQVGFDVEIYSLEDRELVTSYSIDELGVLGFLVLSLDPEGKYLGIGTSGPNSIVIDMTAVMSGVPKMDAVLFNLEGNNANAPQFRVTSDGIGASASFDPVYRVWDINTEELLFEIRVSGHDGVGAVNFTHDGTQLAYEDAGGVIRFTPLDTGEVVERARATVTRGLTDDECRQYLHTDGCVDASG